MKTLPFILAIIATFLYTCQEESTITTDNKVQFTFEVEQDDVSGGISENFTGT